MPPQTSRATIRLHSNFATAQEIKADALANGVDSRGVLTQRYGDDALALNSVVVHVVHAGQESDSPRGFQPANAPM